jgi:hypothetical protein
MRFSEEDEPDRIIDANGDEVAIELLEDDAVLIVDAVNERDKLKAERDRLQAVCADLWRAVKRIEADSRLGLGTGMEVASSALHYVHTYASSAIRAAEKRGFAP